MSWARHADIRTSGVLEYLLEHVLELCGPAHGWGGDCWDCIAWDGLDGCARPRVGGILGVVSRNYNGADEKEQWKTRPSAQYHISRRAQKQLERLKPLRPLDP